MTDTTVDGMNDFVNDTNDIDRNARDLADLGIGEAEELSARARTQRRLSQARSSVSDATIRARRSVKLPARQKAAESEDSGPSASGTIVDHVQAYRTYVLGAAAALLALIAAARTRRSTTQDTDDTVDLGVWHLRADPSAEQA